MKKYLIPAFIIALVGGVYFGVQKVKANPTYVLNYSNQTAPATTSVVYMSPGNATTTLSLDTGNNINYGNTDAFIADNIIVAFQYTASTTASTLIVRPEFSPDNIDWYPYSNQLVTTGTTTNVTGSFAEYSFSLSTSTRQFSMGGSGAGMRFHNAIILPNMARYSRVLFYVPTGGNNGALWAEILGKKQTVNNY